MFSIVLIWKEIENGLNRTGKAQVLRAHFHPIEIECVTRLQIKNKQYYMALSHKDWELPNSRIWLAEMDIDRGLDFPI